MALDKFNKDMAIIAALDDEPNDVGGLTASELKAKFDEGGEALKAYLNETLLPQLERLGVEAALLLPTGAGFKYIRLNADQVLEVSPDGAAWQASGSSGHLILDEDGAALPQRSRMKFVNFSVVDEGGVTVVYGEAANAVSRDGDTMTGDLTISKGVPVLALVNITTGRALRINAGNDNTAGIYNRKDANNIVGLFLRAEKATPYDAAAIQHTYNGVSKYYNLYGEHNIIADQVDYTAGSTALATGAIHLRYE